MSSDNEISSWEKVKLLKKTSRYGQKTHVYKMTHYSTQKRIINIHIRPNLLQFLAGATAVQLWFVLKPADNFNPSSLAALRISASELRQSSVTDKPASRLSSTFLTAAVMGGDVVRRASAGSDEQTSDAMEPTTSTSGVTGSLSRWQNTLACSSVLYSCDNNNKPGTQSFSSPKWIINMLSSRGVTQPFGRRQIQNDLFAREGPVPRGGGRH